jgi:glycosyltransferase involved in cell wall biosynthesis
MISVIIPAWNEAERIEKTLCALREIPDLEEILVIDDGSADGTAQIAERAGATVLRLPENRGKGYALTIGVEAARGDILLLLDADLQESAAEAVKLLTPVLHDEADMTIATFPVIPGAGGGVGLVVRLARYGIRRITGRTMIAPLSGQRALRRAVLHATEGFDAGFGAEVGLTIDALCAGLRVLEVPTQMSHRITGRDARATLHRARQFVAVLRALWARRGRQCSHSPR